MQEDELFIKTLGLEKHSPSPSHPSAQEHVGKSAEEKVSPEDDHLFVSAMDALETTPFPVTEREEHPVQSHPIQKHVIDLHGLNAEQARLRVKQFLSKGKVSGELLLIVGKGLHSANEPVLRTLIPNLLNHVHAAAIKGWKWAKAKEGGKGAIKVRLKD